MVLPLFPQGGGSEGLSRDHWSGRALRSGSSGSGARCDINCLYFDSKVVDDSKRSAF